MSKIRGIKGMNDLFPPDTGVWGEVLCLASLLFSGYGFKEIKTPVVERTELFVRGVGEGTAIVEKEMYVFEDKKGLSCSLRPEATAPTVRAYIEAGLHIKEPQSKFWYFGPMFRYERPQKGRYRQFHQIGAEIFGVKEPLGDVEIILMLNQFFKKLNLNGITLQINSLGSKESLAKYTQVLTNYLKDKKDGLSEDSQRRLNKNPLRILDSKEEADQNIIKNAPEISEYWDEDSKNHYEAVLSLLNSAGVSFVENRRIVRGLDYYCGTTFEFLSNDLGAQNAVAAGGRYDGLIKDLGGGDLPGVGFAIGMERLVLLKPELSSGSAEKLFFALLGQNVQAKMLPIIQKLRENGQVVEVGYGGNLKNQMKRANRLGATKVIIAGETELAKNVVIVKEMATGEQKEIALDKLK